MLDESIYYDYKPILSRNGVYNMIVGGRGIGKSWGAKYRVVKRAISHGEEFVYIRRFDTHLKTSKASFFADIAFKFPGYQFKVEGDYAYYAVDDGEKAAEWKKIGYFYALSKAQSIKSTAFPDVKTMIFDEFINEPGGAYLPDEFVKFNNFYNTIDRFQDRVRVYFLANAVSIDNPYFRALGIHPDECGEWSRFMSGFVVVHFPESDAYKNSIKNSRFGRFIEGTEYEKYAVGNEFADAHHKLIGSKGSNAKYWFTLELRNGKFSVWQDMETGELFVYSKLPKVQVTYVVDPERVDRHARLLLRNDLRLKHLRQTFQRGLMVFDKPATRNTFLGVLN